MDHGACSMRGIRPECEVTNVKKKPEPENRRLQKGYLTIEGFDFYACKMKNFLDSFLRLNGRAVAVLL